MLHGDFYNWIWGFSKLWNWETSHSWLAGYLHKSLKFHLQLSNWAELWQTNPRIKTALTEQELLLLAKAEREREISHCSSCKKQGISPTFCLVALGGIGAALLEENHQVIEGYVEIKGKHDGGCKPKHLKGQNNKGLSLTTAPVCQGRSKLNQTHTGKTPWVVWPFQKGREGKLWLIGINWITADLGA